MIIATLCLISRKNKEGEEILLAEKKEGEIGTGVLAGPGGKQEGNETFVECLIRETKEELDIELYATELEHVATIDTYNAGALDFRIYVYRTNLFSGEIKETEEMIPAWYPTNNLPFDRMFESDRHWLLKAVHGEKFCARVYYYKRAKGFLNIEFNPFILL